MAIIQDKGKGEPIKSKPIKYKPIKYKPKKKPKVTYKCDLCKDTGLVEVKGLKVKCKCVVKKELIAWVKPPIDVYLKKVDLKKKINLDLESSKILFRDVNPNTIYSWVARKLLLDYYKKGMQTFSYYVISGDEFTEAYTSGEHNKYLDCNFLLLIVGGDNYNKTLQTTITTTILHRERKQLTTWLLTLETYRATGSLSDLYGDNFLKLVEDKSFWDSILLNQNGKVKKVK